MIKETFIKTFSKRLLLKKDERLTVVKTLNVLRKKTLIIVR